MRLASARELSTHFSYVIDEEACVRDRRLGEGDGREGGGGREGEMEIRGRGGASETDRNTRKRRLMLCGD